MGDKDEAQKKKRKVKNKVVSSSKTEKKSDLDVTKSIDELFDSVKKNKASMNEVAKSGKGKKDNLSKKKKQSKHNFEEDDGGMEYFDTDDEDEKPNVDETENRSYGLIKSRYNPSHLINPEAPLERIDPESGLPVYKAHLLKVGEGGGTALCPFDCSCCF